MVKSVVKNIVSMFSLFFIYSNGQNNFGQTNIRTAVLHTHISVVSMWFNLHKTEIFVLWFFGGNVKIFIIRISTSFFALKSQHALQWDLKFTHTKNRYLTTSCGKIRWLLTVLIKTEIFHKNSILFLVTDIEIISSPWCQSCWQT